MMLMMKRRQVTVNSLWLVVCLLWATRTAAFAPVLRVGVVQTRAVALLNDGANWKPWTASSFNSESTTAQHHSSVLFYQSFRPSSLRALSPTATATATTAALAVGHVIGGSLAVPLVFKATSSWYKKIALPKWTPPDRVFGPVWTFLYACMGIALARVIQRLPAGGVPAWKSPAVLLWIFHYALNLSWAPIFFSAKRLRLGLWINYLLVGTLTAVVFLFWKSNPTSAALLVPYALWLAYATALNQAICKLNPTDSNGYNAAKFEDELIRLQKKAATFAGL